jgi:hypothetical protein
MAHIPVTKETMAKKRLKPLENFNFLANLPVVEVVLGEFSSAAATYPIFFVEREGGYTPVALLSLINDQNMFVEPNGSWSGYYLPAAFRRFPFTVGPAMIEGKEVPALLVDEAMLSDTEGDLLYGEEGKDEAESPIGRTMRLITETDRHHAATRNLVAELAAAGLIRNSDLQVQLVGQKHNITGLFGIDEKKLQELPDDAFLKLRHSGALSLAHIQLQSVGQVQRLVMRHNVREAIKRGEKPVSILD